VRRSKNKSSRSRARRIAGWLLRGLGAFVVLSMLAVFALRVVDPPLTSIMLQRWSEARLAGDGTFALKRRWRALADLPHHVGQAVITAEDQRFFQHWGFDTTEMEHALEAHLEGEPLRGASTITQQLAKNLFLWEGRSLLRKALEVHFTIWLELLLSKRRILELYLNIAEFGRGVFGVGAAARHHFDLDARRLSPEQAAALAAILPSPLKRSARHPSPRVLRKQQWILERMHASNSRGQPSFTSN
jgi:monofunctional biosynthetic peptidoglycan transglycosylase